MPSGDIKTSLKLDGEQQYRSGMTAAARAVKTLDSELKLAKAQFQQSGDAQQYAADRARILKEQIEQQKTAVATAEKALQQLTAQGFEKNSREVQNWTRKLNEAKTGLTRMETDLSKAQSELGQQADAFEATADSVDDYNSAINSVQTPDFAGALHALDNVQQRFDTIISTAAKAARAIWTMEVDASQWADELVTAANVARLDPQVYQSWQYASRFIDTSVDTIIKERDRIEKELGSSSKETAEAFNALLVPTRNADGTVRDATAVFWDAIDALHGIPDATERGIKAEKLFGKTWTELNPLINAGSKAYLELADSAEEAGAVVSADGVDALGAFNDEWQKLDAQLTATKYQLLSELAPAFTEVAGAMSTAVTALNDFLETEEGQATLQNVKDAFAGIADQFKNADVAALIEKGAGTVQSLSSALGWIGDHADAVAGAIGVIGAALAGLKVTTEVLTFMNLLQKVGTAGAVAGAAKGVGVAGAGAAGAGAAGAAAGGGFLAKAGAFASGVVLPVAEVAAIGYGFKLAADERKFNENIRGGTKAIETATEGNAELQKAFLGYIDANQKWQRLADSGDLYSPEAGAAAEAVDAANQELRAIEGWSEVMDKYSAWRQENSMGSMDWSLPSDVRELFGGSAAGTGSAAQAMGGIAAGIDAVAKAETERARGLQQAFLEYVEAQRRLQEMNDSGDIFGPEYGAQAEAADAATKQLQALEGYTELLGAYSRWRQENSMGAMDWGLPEDLSEIFGAGFDGSELEDAGANAEAGLARGFAESQEAVAAATDKAAEVVNAVMGAWAENSPSKVFADIGGNAVAGLAQGIYSRGAEAIAAATWLANAVASTMRAALMIHSPSRVFEELGGYVSEGFAIGIQDGIDAVTAAASDMAEATSRGISVPRRSRDAAGGSAAGMAQVTLVLDGEVLGAVLTPLVNDTLGAEIEQAR